MRVLLVNPPQTYQEGAKKPQTRLPLSLLYLGATLRQADHNVRVLDTTCLENAYTRKDGFFEKGLIDWGIIKEAIEKTKTDVVGITCPFTTQLQNTLRMAKVVKSVYPTVPVIVGGPHASVCPTDFFKKGDSIDIIVRGEGEYILLNLVNCLETKSNLDSVCGIAYQHKGKIIQTKPANFIDDLDKLPFPAYDLVDVEAYITKQDLQSYRGVYSIKEIRQLPMITSRGCPFNCVFCSICLHMGRKWRAHSSAYVLDHLEYVVDRYGVNFVHFEDDNLTLNPKRFEEILDGMKRRRIGIDWATPNGVRADTLNRSVLNKVKQSGCSYLAVAAESGSQRVLDHIIGKNLKLSSIWNIAKMCKKIGVPLKIFFVIGFPGETREDIQKTIQFAWNLKKKFNARPLFNIATPLFGTRLYDICEAGGYFTRKPTPAVLATASQPENFSGLIKTEEFTPHYLSYSYTIFKIKSLFWDMLTLPKNKYLKTYLINRTHALLS